MCVAQGEFLINRGVPFNQCERSKLSRTRREGRAKNSNIYIHLSVFVMVRGANGIKKYHFKG